MKAKDHIEIIEAAYTLDLPRPDWQRRLMTLMHEHWPDGVTSFVFDASAPGKHTASHFMICGDEADLVGTPALASVNFPPHHARAMFLRAPAMAHIVDLLGPEAFNEPWAHELAQTAPGLMKYGLGLRTLDPSGHGLTFGFHFPLDQPIPAALEQTWSQIGTHIGIAYRLRRLLGQLAEGDELSGEAVLSLDGRVEHADGAARSIEAREILREAARRVMAARTMSKRRDTDEALELWQGIVDGRWSLVDRFDSDGKHFLVAHRNPPDVTDRRALTERETQVAAYLAMGMSNKLIGYALGLSASAVATHIASIGRKLGIRSRVELVTLLDALQAATDEPAT